MACSSGCSWVGDLLEVTSDSQNIPAPYTVPVAQVVGVLGGRRDRRRPRRLEAGAARRQARRPRGGRRASSVPVLARRSLPPGRAGAPNAPPRSGATVDAERQPQESLGPQAPVVRHRDRRRVGRHVPGRHARARRHDACRLQRPVHDREQGNRRGRAELDEGQHRSDGNARPHRHLAHRHDQGCRRCARRSRRA